MTGLVREMAEQGVLPDLVPDQIVGLWRVKLVSGGPWCGVRVTYGPTCDPESGEPLDRSWLWTVEVGGVIDGEPSPDVWASGAGLVAKRGERIEEPEYRYLVALAQHAKTHDSTLPEARPRERADLGRMQPIF